MAQPQPFRRFFGLPTTPPDAPSPAPTEAPTPAPSEHGDGVVTALVQASEALTRLDLWEDQPEKVQKAWTAYGSAVNEADRHAISAVLIHTAAAACKAHESWVREPAVRDAFARAGKAWDIADARRRQGAGR